jgi:YbbR domain-containing protein
MIDQLIRLIRRDFWFKTLALALAILLWAMVVQDYNKETTVEFSVPLVVKQHPRWELFEGKQDLQVDVRVTGPNLLVSRLSEDEIHAWVDYGRVAEPNKAQDVEVQVEGPPAIKDQVRYRVTPSFVTVTLVERGTANVPVEVRNGSGVIPVGDREYRYTAVPDPKSVQLSGRTDQLSLVRIGLVTLEQRDLIPPLVGGELREKTVTVNKPVQPLDATGKVVEKLPQQYANVTLTWEELPPGKQVQVRPKTIGSLPPGFELESVTVDPERVILRSGTVEGRLPEVSTIETEPVDLTEQTKSFTTAARLITPPGTNAAVTSVSVTVTVKEKQVEKIFGAVPIAITGQPPGTEVTLPVQAIQVRLTGPFTVMQPMDASAVKAYVDLAGLGVGRHRVPVKVDAPPGLPEYAVDPAIVEVVITNR